MVRLHPLVAEPLSRLIGAKCYRTLVEQLDVFDTPCRNLAISKALGFGIVVGGSIVKVPQVLKILNARSAQGLSLASALLETAGYAISLAYNIRSGNPFSTYGETLFITIQNVVILSLILCFRGRKTLGALTPLAFLGVSVALADVAIVGDYIMAYLQMATIPNIALSRAPQIYENYKNQSTGQLSAITTFLFFAGAIARVFTTMQEVKDSLLLAGFLLGALFNGSLLFQILYYWKSTAAKAKIRKPVKAAQIKKQRSRKME